MKDLDEERVAIITGASSGIGEATCYKFAEEGFKVVTVGRNEERLMDLKQSCEQEGGCVFPIIADLTKQTDIKRIIDTTVREFGRIDVLVNSAGIIKLNGLMDTSLEEWREVFTINVDSIFLLMKEAVPFLEQTGGSIVNVSSVAGIRAFPGIFAYTVSKAAVDQITRAAALELAKKGVRVNAVNPGVVETELHVRAGLTQEEYQEFLEQSKKTHPLGRVGQPEEIAELIYYLASPKAAWITGETISIDGGRFLTCLR